MEPIISPWIFYWMDVAVALSIVSTIATIVSAICLTFLVLAANDPCNNDDERANVTKYAKRIVMLFAVSLAFSVFIPSKDTMYKMLVTSYVTPNNIELVGGSIDTALDKLTDKVVKIKEAK